MHALLEDWRQTFILPSTFAPPELEAEFLRHYSRRYGHMRFVSSTIGLSIWIAYFLIDLVLIKLDPDFAKASSGILALHVISTAIISLYYLLVCRTPRFIHDELFASRTTSAGCVLFALFIVAKQVIAPYPYDFIYYFLATTILIIFCFGLYRLRARDIVIVLGIIISIQLTAIWYRAIVGIPPEIAQVRLAYALLCSTLLITTAVIGFGVGVQFERAERQTFTNEQDLQRINDALSQRNIEVEGLKTESVRQLQALVDAQASLRAEAEQRSRDKSRFLASAVHDLRQPLQAISNALLPASLAAERDDPAKTRQLITLAQTAADAMRKQLSAILNLSRLESGLIRAEIVNLELTTLIDEVVRQQRPVAVESHVALDYDFPSGTRIHVRSDPAFVERILLNLIGNGIKYRSPSQVAPKVRVELAVDEEQGIAIVSVIDNGLGIDTQHIASQAIFEPFFQANNALPESEKGVGLGLSIVRAMVANMPEHAIDVTSELDQGSCFRLTLPLSRSLAPDSLRQIAPLQAASDLSQCYVVLVEDDKLVLQSTLALFDATGVRYEAYDSYEHFLAGIAHFERIPDVILSDFRLPNQRTAIDVIDLARQHFPDIGVVVFSGEVGLAESHGSLPDVTIIAKPLSPDDLLQAIANAFAAQRPA